MYDNYHYGDESEAYDYGEYASYEEAENAAKEIVQEFFKQNWEKGMDAESLLALYGLYGEDPVVLPSDQSKGKRF